MFSCSFWASGSYPVHLIPLHAVCWHCFCPMVFLVVLKKMYYQFQYSSLRKSCVIQVFDTMPPDAFRCDEHLANYKVATFKHGPRYLRKGCSGMKENV